MVLLYAWNDHVYPSRGSREQRRPSKGRHFYSLVFPEEFTKIYNHPACRNSVCPSKFALTCLFLLSTHLPASELEPVIFENPAQIPPRGGRIRLLFLFRAEVGAGNWL